MTASWPRQTHRRANVSFIPQMAIFVQFEGGRCKTTPTTGCGVKMIGIVGGVGPYAGLDLVRKILDQTAARRDQEHLSIYLANEPAEIPDRTAFLVGQEKMNPAFAVARIVRKLESLGVTVVGIPCNTFHAPPIFDVLTAELRQLNSQVTVLHMVHETVQRLRDMFPAGARVGILSTTGTARSGVYPLHLRRAGLVAVMVPEALLRDVVHPAIYDPHDGIKARSNPVTAPALAALRHAAEWLVGAGAQAIILGCTEIPLAITEDHLGGVPLVDPARVLARALIRAEDAGRLRPESG